MLRDSSNQFIVTSWDGPGWNMAFSASGLAITKGFLHGGSSDVDGLVAVAVDAFDHAGVSVSGKVGDVFSGDAGVREQGDGVHNASGQADYFEPPLRSPVMISIKTWRVFP